MSERLELKDKIFGRLTVLEFSHIRKNATYWKTKCECGNVKVVNGPKLKIGHTKSCGCLGREHLGNSRRSHGQAHKIPEYKAWAHLKSRCLCKTNLKYPTYGGRGITVCESWMKFENFYKDMGNKPSPSHSIDRIDNNGNYEPKNCRWATANEQSRNQRSNIYLDTEYGKTIMADACRKYGINHTAILYLVKAHHIPHQDAFQEIILERGCW